MHDKTFEVQASLRLSLWNVIIVFSTLFVLIGLIIFTAISLTPLKNLVVGYSEVATSRQVITNNRTTDSILHQLDAYEAYFGLLQKRLSGESDSLIPFDSLRAMDYSTLVVDGPSELDKGLRNEVAQEDLFNLSIGDGRITGSENIESLHFFPPVKGTVTSGFNGREGHYGTDIVAQENTPIKACLDGVVLDAYWNIESGNVIIVQHDHGLISFYKHNSQLLKRSGNTIRAGDVIAIIGNTGELSTGPHLHFELWHDKVPLNPEKYINFN
jgi:murein DD-endopeptidase MepM/ murein hydrolase activator NlpD